MLVSCSRKLCLRGASMQGSVLRGSTINLPWVVFPLCVMYKDWVPATYFARLCNAWEPLCKSIMLIICSL